MKVSYSEDLRVAYFDGYKFRRDAKTGYYLSTKNTDVGHRERLHCYVWRFHNGEIPTGYHVHHVNEDKQNNDIENLACVRGEIHNHYHSEKRVANEYGAMCDNLRNNAAPEAAKWHGSEAGRAWHSKHAKETAANLKEKRFICAFCGKEFYKKPMGGVKFCSPNCKTKARNRSGIDNETRRCVVCGGEFVANKYSKIKCCSAQCGHRVRRAEINKEMRG